MFKALLKKQLMEINRNLFYDRRKQSQVSNGRRVFFIILYVFVFVSFGFMFGSYCAILCPSLLTAGQGWLYFAINILTAMLLGIFGSVFITYSTLYLAKDNDLLLSMPIPPKYIIFVRLVGVWFWGFIFSLVVMVPSCIVYGIFAGVTVWSVLFQVIGIFVVSLVVLGLAGLLGWCVAKLSKYIKNKQIGTIIFTLVLLGIYYLFYFKAQDILQGIVASSDKISTVFANWLFPLYMGGQGLEGKPLPMLVFVAIGLVFFFLVYLLISKGFIKMATMKQGVKQKAYVEKSMSRRSQSAALFAKELKRFTSSATYMLNCGLGILFMVVAAVFLFIKGNSLVGQIRTSIGEVSDIGSMLEFLAVLAICALGSMIDVSAPSISLEGKSLWVLRSLPVKTMDILMAKLRVHALLGAVPTLLISISVTCALKPEPVLAAEIIVLPILFVCLEGVVGLFANLKTPMLNWSDETVPIKQSMSVLIAILGGWGVLLVLLGLYFVFAAFLSTEIYLAICIVLVAIAILIVYNWLKKKGVMIFEGL